jgi:hypothetical protein
MDYIMEAIDSSQETSATGEQGSLTAPASSDKSSKKAIIIVGLIAVILIGAFVAFAIFLVQADAGKTAQIRDVFIIVMALEALLIGAALIILSVQVAILINLLQNEVKPILNSTTETVNTLRGTVSFLSNNLTEPVIKMNEYLAGIRKVFDLIRLVRK